MIDDVLLHGLHAQQAHDHFHGEVFRQKRQNTGRMVGADARQDDGDGLRVLVLQVVGEHRFVHVAHLVPHGAAGGAAHFFHDGIDALPGQGRVEQAFGGVDGADQTARRRQLVGEFDEQPFDDRGMDIAEGRHGGGQFADFLVVHALEQHGRLVLMQGQQEDRRFLGAR